MPAFQSLVFWVRWLPSLWVTGFLVWGGTPLIAQDEAAPLPPFDELTSPELGFFDVFYGGESLGSHIVEFDGERFRFETPDDVMAILPIEDTDGAIRGALSGLIDRNSQAACRPGSRPSSCGTIEPDIAGAILDVRAFRIELFVNPEYLPGAERFDAGYLPQQSRELSAIMANRLVISGDADNDPDFALLTNGQIALAGGRVETRLTTNSQDLRIEALSYEFDFERRRLSAGVVQMEPLPVIGYADFVGVQLQSAFDRVRNRSQLFAEPLEVFLQRRSRVEIYREDRLLHAATYDAGNQQLDTADLPQGSYLIRIRIIDPVSGPIEEERFFVNRQAGGPIGQTTFIAELGIGRNRGVDDVFDPLSDIVIARFGLSRRLTRFVRPYGDIAIAGDEFVAAGGMDYSGARFNTRISAIANNQGASGFQAFASARLGQTALSLSARSLSGVTLQPGEFALVSGQFETLNATMTRPFGRVIAGVRARQSQIGTGERNWEINPFVRWPLGSIAGTRLDLSSEASWSEEESRVLIRLSARRLRGRSSAGAETTLRRLYNRDNGQSALESEVSVNYGIRRPDSPWGAASFRVDGFANRDTRAATADAELRNRYGRFSATLNASDTGRDTDIGYAANADFGIALANGRWSFMGDQLRRSAALVSISGLETGSFDINVNGQAAGTIRPGRSRAVPLHPYREYRIAVSPRGDTIAGIDTAPRSFIAYPGSVGHLEWEAFPVILFVSQVVDPAGEPLARARVLSRESVSLTDAFGYIQVEARPGSELELRQSNGETCLLTLPQPDDVARERAIQIIDRLVCAPVTEAIAR